MSQLASSSYRKTSQNNYSGLYIVWLLPQSLVLQPASPWFSSGGQRLSCPAYSSDLAFAGFPPSLCGVSPFPMSPAGDVELSLEARPCAPHLTGISLRLGPSFCFLPSLTVLSIAQRGGQLLRTILDLGPGSGHACPLGLAAFRRGQDLLHDLGSRQSPQGGRRTAGLGVTLTSSERHPPSAGTSH